MFDLSKYSNPYFYYAPFAGVITSTSGFHFPPRMFSNKSAAHPDNGILNKAVLKSFFATSGPDNALVYTFGHECIPSNFYKRAIGNEYTAIKFWDGFQLFVKDTPHMVSTGGITGKVKSYAALDISNFTGGVFSSAGLLDNGAQGLKCFVFQSSLAGAPDVLQGGVADVPGVMRTLTDRVNSVLGGLICPQIWRLNEEQFARYPGARYKSQGVLGGRQGSVWDMIVRERLTAKWGHRIVYSQKVVALIGTK